MRLQIPTAQQAITQSIRGVRLLLDSEWYKFLCELGRQILVHVHDGVYTSKVSHNNLTDIGENTHPEIDAALSDLYEQVDKRPLPDFLVNTKRVRFLAMVGGPDFAKRKTL